MMRFFNSNIDKAKLRRNALNRNEIKSVVRQKASLSKRIIAERIASLSKQRSREHNEMLELNDRLRELYDEVQYKVTHYQRLICFDESKITILAEMIIKGDKLLKQFYNKEIDIKECIKGWEELNQQITTVIENWVNTEGQHYID